VLVALGTTVAPGAFLALLYSAMLARVEPADPGASRPGADAARA
jgi:predicted exporter